MNNQPLLQQILQLQQEILNQQILVVDQLYAKAYEHFQLCVIISFIYSLIKFIAAPFFLFYSDPQKQLQQIWLIIIIPFSVLQAAYYWQVRKFSKNKLVFLKIGDIVGHASYFTPNQVSLSTRQSNIHDGIVNFRNLATTQIIDKQIKILSLQVKYDVLKQNWKIMIIGRVLFCIYTGLHIWGYIIFQTTGDPNLADYYIIVVFFLGTYQYLQVYLGILGLIIAVPFMLIYFAVKAIKKKRRAYVLQRRLKAKKYNPETIQGQKTCHICMEEYKQGDMLTTLQCNIMHHFHEDCLNQWIRVSGTCPLCRVQIQFN